MGRYLSRVLLVAILNLLPYFCSAVPQGAVELASAKPFSVRGGWCGQVDGQWLPGRMIQGRYFVSLVQEQKNAMIELSRSYGEKREWLLGKVIRLRKRNRKLRAVCKAGARPSGSPTATPIALSTLPSSPTIRPTSPVPLPTAAATATPMPTVNPTESLAATPTATASPTPGSTGGGLVVLGVEYYSVLSGASIYASDDQFLGIFSNNKFQLDSIASEFNSYGSRFGSNSIFNNFSQYGSRFASKSVFNEFASQPPILYDGDTPLAYLTANRSLSPRVDPATVFIWLGKADDIP